MLVADSEAGYGVESHNAVVVGGAEGGEETGGDGEERHMFDVRVMFRGVRHNVVYVVVAFPPADR